MRKLQIMYTYIYIYVHYIYRIHCITLVYISNSVLDIQKHIYRIVYSREIANAMNMKVERIYIYIYSEASSEISSRTHSAHKILKQFHFGYIAHTISQYCPYYGVTQHSTRLDWGLEYAKSTFTVRNCNKIFVTLSHTMSAQIKNYIILNANNLTRIIIAAAIRKQ